MIGCSHEANACRRLWVQSSMLLKLGVVVHASTGRKGQEGQKFKVMLCFIGSLRPAWNT